MDPPSVRQVETLCRQGWGFGGIREVVRLDPEPGSAALYRVTTDDRELLLTEHRRDRKDRDLQRATAGASFLAGLDFPTPIYWATLDGSSVLTLEGRLYTLRTWVPGAPPVRTKLNLHTMSLLGRALGWCHTLLAELPISDTVKWPTRVEIALTEVEAAVKLIGARQDGGDSDREVLGVLLRKRNLLENAPDLPSRFKEYRTQIVHGDYHVENVIVSAHGGLAGVIDLGVRPGYPVWELYYALFWSLREWDTAAFDMTVADAFLKGYLDEGRMTAEEIVAGPEMLYWWLLLETWNTKVYADNPADLDAHAAILWFHRVDTWLADNGQRLGKDLARQVTG